jgi:hypothetical protein
VHEHGRAQALQNLLFFLGEGSTVVAILSPLNRPIDMDRHPFFVFGKRISLISFGGRGVSVRNPLNSAAFARYCCAVDI